MADHPQTTSTRPEALPGDQMVMRDKVVDLAPLNVVAQGNRRFVYLIHPGTPGFEGFNTPLVLKLPRYQDREDRMNTPKRLLSRLFPGTAERGIRVEASYWTKLARRVPGDPIDMPLPVFRGYVMTTGGRAALWDAMCDADGKLAPTLNEVERIGSNADLIEPLNRFVAFSYKYNLVAPDIQSVNMVLVHRKGRWETVLIDGYADMRLISMRSMFAWRNAQNMDNRFTKMARQTNLKFDIESRTYSLPDESSNTTGKV